MRQQTIVNEGDSISLFCYCRGLNYVIHRGDKTFQSRLFTGIEASSLTSTMLLRGFRFLNRLLRHRRESIFVPEQDDILTAHHELRNLLPNTSGAKNAKDAISLLI
ncbi:hypothetical protein OK016_08790 [Vibrio chagasii]|nr:hypothetical protein [Vibrio chagasii]